MRLGAPMGLTIFSPLLELWSMTAGGGALFGEVVIGAAAFVPFIATSAIVTARTTTSATAARAAGIRPKLDRAGAAVTEADIWILRWLGSGAPIGVIGAPAGQGWRTRLGAGAPGWVR